jgi:Fe-S-cluster-containing dehydrogenase component
MAAGGSAVKKWYMIIDVAKCEDCNNCLLACKDEHVDNDWPGYTAPQPRHGHRWMDVARTERGQFPLIDVAYRPTPCMHCAAAPCVTASNGAVQQRTDGLVLLDPLKSKGQRQLVNACPYGAIWWNEALGMPQKCTFCAHLIDWGWKQPRCVQACPTGALEVRFLDESDMGGIAEELKLTCLHPEFETQPRVLYANLYRYAACFIAGSVAVLNEAAMDCCAKAVVRLKQGDKTVAHATTDAFGDFRFDGLAENSTSYTIEIEAENYGKRSIPVPQLTASVNVGTICFGP